MAKVTVHVNKAFVLTREDSSRVAYSAGTHSMPEEDAGHWYVKHHLSKPEVREETAPPSAPPSGEADESDSSGRRKK